MRTVSKSRRTSVVSKDRRFSDYPDAAIIW